MTTEAPAEQRYKLFFFLIFLLISFNLRMAFAAADPLLVFLMRDLKLNIESGGLFALIPVAALGIAAPVGTRLVRLVRPSYLIIYALLFAIFGVVWRSYGGIPGLYGGTLCIGLGLGITGSVILGLVKSLFPEKVPELMGSYTAFSCLGISIGSASADPIALYLGGWQEGLLFWSLPLLLAVILWSLLVLWRHPLQMRHSTLQARILPLLRQPQAWHITLFYLCRVAGSWLLVSWLAMLMRQRGLSLEEAGMVLALATAMEIPSALLSNQLSRYLGSQSLLMAVSIPLSVLACGGLLLGPLDFWPLFSAIFGLCIGTIFTLGMTLIVNKAADETSTVSLSGMAQGIGFIGGGAVAWVASPLVNSAHPQEWISLAYALISLSGLLFGILSDRPGQVALPQTRDKDKSA